MQSHIPIPALSALRRFPFLAFILVGLAVLLGGCAPMKLDPAADQNIRNVAVISLVPEQADFINELKGQGGANLSATDHQSRPSRDNWRPTRNFFSRTNAVISIVA
jgi:hypothetical protein